MLAYVSCVTDALRQAADVADMSCTMYTHSYISRLVNNTCKYYCRYRYRYVLLKVSTILIPILLQKLAAILLPITFEDATCDRNYVGLPRYFLTIIKNDIIDDSLTRKTNSKIHNVYYKTTKNFESVWKTVILIISIYKMFET